MTPSRSPGVARQHTPRPSPLNSILVPALVALALVLVACSGGGSSPSPSFAPTATPVVTAEQTPTDEPTVAPTAQPTPEPLAQWTGLTWSDPVTPSSTMYLRDVVPWEDGYVAAGRIPVGAGLSQAAFFTSPDGLHWTVTYQIDPVGERFPEHLVVFDDSLFAFSPRAADDVEIILPSGGYSGPLIWTSSDGVDWEFVDSPSWEDGWAGARQHVGGLPPTWDQAQIPILTGLVAVAAGPTEMVAIGNTFGTDEMVPVVLRSTDGSTWTEVSLPPDSPSALLHDVAAFAGGYALVGSVNVGSQADTATPAAWFSPDGVTWTRSTVNVDEELYPAGIEGIGDFVRVEPGADGLLGWYGYREMVIGGPTRWQEWSSADGQTWVPLDQRAADPNRFAGVVGDGVRMVAVPNTWHPDTGQSSPIDRAWVSTDGVTWSPLTWPALSDPSEGIWVVPDGVIYAGQQSFWFGAAQVAE